MTHESAFERGVDVNVERSSKLPARGLLFAFGCAIAALTIAVDQISKQLALVCLSTDARIPLVGDLLGLQLAFNTGAAFSLGSEITPLITLLGFFASVLLIRAMTRVRQPVKSVAIGLILGGALGNLADRLVAPPGFGRGAVTDFLAYGDLFIGNIADIAIGAGVVLYLLAAWRTNAGTPNHRSRPSAGYVSDPTVKPSKTVSQHEATEVPGNE